MDIRIVVLQRGWVLVGHYERRDVFARLTRCRCIRRWGTTRGLAQIANEGPTRETQLDDGAPAEWHVLAEVMTLRCDPAAWVDHLPEGQP